MMSRITVPPVEPHYTVAQIARQWQVSDDTVRDMFSAEPGVLKIGRGPRLEGRGRKKKLRRGWFMLRIPESVFLRVQASLMAEPGRAPAPHEHAPQLARAS
jgi:hypothetical protein